MTGKAWQQSIKDCLTDRHRVAIALRLSLVNFVAYVLSVADLPNVVPPSMRYLIGVLTASLSMSTPPLVFAMGMIISTMVLVVLLALKLSTLLLQVATMSNGGLTALFAIITLWLSGLRFESGLVSVIPNTVVIICSSITLSLLEAAQSDSSIVHEMWTTTGLDNPAAFITNFLVIFCWALLLISMVAVLPPWGTARNLFTKTLAPGALKSMAQHLECYVDTLQSPTAQVRDIQPNESAEGACQKRLVELTHMATILGDGESGMLIAFEPRLAHPLTCDWILMKRVLKDINDAVVMVIAASEGFGKTEDDEEGPDHNDVPRQVLTECVRVMQECASVMISDEELDPVTFPLDGIDLDSPAAIRTLPLAVAVQKMVSSINVWNHAIHGKASNSSLRNLGLNIRPWIGTHISTFKILFQEIIMVLSPSTYLRLCRSDMRSSLQSYSSPIMYAMAWYLKFAIGATLLFCLRQYSFAIRHFAIPVFSSDSTTISFAGWHMVSYLAATTCTAQGTIKKGMVRFAGTLLGSFSAWAAINACGMYPNTNVYGLIAWLTTSTVVVSLAIVQPGMYADLGTRKDVAPFGKYFLMTQALIGLEAYNGVHDLNGLTVNRITATCTGVLMAMIFAVIPPIVNGANPQFVRNRIALQTRAMSDLAQKLLQMTEVSPEEVRKDIEKLSNQCRRWRDLTTMIYQDATTLLPGWRWCSADPRILVASERAHVNWAKVETVYAYAIWLLGHHDFDSTDQLITISDELHQISKEGGGKKVSQETTFERDEGYFTSSKPKESDHRLILLVSFMKSLSEATKEQKDYLDNVDSSWNGKEQ